LSTRMHEVPGSRAFGAREVKKEPMEYMTLCRTYLSKLDTKGCSRSYHQRLFHDDFLKACTRSFWKLEAPEQSARDHQRMLRAKSWDHIAQEILISTPRRFGKTISVSIFCAAVVPWSGNQHLQHMQAYQPEDSAQRTKVCVAYCRRRLYFDELCREARKYGRNQSAGSAD
jgi:hypothetical protein